MKASNDFIQFSESFVIDVGGQFGTLHTTDFQRFDTHLLDSDWAFNAHEVPDDSIGPMSVRAFRINRNVLDRREANVPYEQVVEFVESNNGFFMGTYGLISVYLSHHKIMRKTGMRFISPDVPNRMPIVCRPSVRYEPIDEVPYILGAEWDRYQYGSIQAELGLDGHCVVLLFQKP